MCLGGAALAQGPETIPAANDAAEKDSPRERPAHAPVLEIPWTTTPPQIDGAVSPGEWENALELALEPSWDPKKLEPDDRFAGEVSAARLMWDERCLYVLFGSLLPPSNAQAALVEAHYKSLGGAGEPPEEEGELIEAFSIAWDPRPPSAFGMPPKIPGAFRLRLFIGLQNLQTGDTPLLFETQAGYRGTTLPEGLASDGWSPELPLKAYALQGTRAEAAIPFARLNSLYGLLSGSEGIRPAKGIERFTPPSPGEAWEFRFERRHDAERFAARGGSPPLFSLAPDAAEGGGGATLRFGPPPEEEEEGHAKLDQARHPLPPYFLDNYLRGARRATEEGKPLILLYTVGEFAALEESRRFWEDRRVVNLSERAVFVWLNPRRLPESAPSFGARQGVEIVALMPSGRVAKRWRGMPRLEDFLADVDALAGEGTRRR